MSDDIKKNLRTQGKYSDNGNTKYRDKRQKESPTDKEPPGKKPHPIKRNSNGSSDQNSSLTASETDSPIKYEENSEYTFDNLEEKKPTEVKTAGVHIISETNTGVSSILYEPTFIDLGEGNDLYDELLETTKWNTKNIVIRGVEYPQPRLVAWYGPFPYTYSGVTLEPAEMPECVLRLKDRIEDYLLLKDIKVTLNSVLLNFYRSGHDSVAWHSDDELTMGVCPTIASISLGETRKFEMRRKPESYDTEVSLDAVDQLYLNLIHGSLLIMNGVMQDDWQHRIPKEYHDKDGRINLTFRTVYSLETNQSRTSFKDFKSKLVESIPSEKSCSPGISFSDGDFPPLGSPVSVSERTPPSSHLLNPSMNFQVKEDVDKSMDSIDAAISNESIDTSVAPVSFSSSLVNNLNEESNSKNMHDKYINPNDSFTSDSDLMTTDDSIEKNTSYGASYDFDGPVDSASKFDNKMYADKISTNLNVEAQEFYPIHHPIVAVDVPQEINYDSLDLWKLILVDIQEMDDDSYLKYTDALKERVFQQIYDFTLFQREDLEFITTLIEKSSCQFSQNLARRRLYKVVKGIYERFYSGNYTRNSSYRSGFLREDRLNSQKENNPNPRKRFSYEESRNRGENPSRGDGFSNRHKSAQPQHERHTSQGEEYSSLHEKYSSRDDENSSKGDRNFIRDDRHSNKDDDYSRGGKNFSKVGGHSNRDDDYQSSRGGRTSGKRYSNKGFESSRRDEEHSNKDETFSSRGYKSNRRGNASRAPRLSRRGEGNFNRGQGHHDREGGEQKETDSNH